MADLAALFSGIEALVKSDATAGDAFSRAIDLCAAQTPHDDWERFRELDVEADLAELSLWLESLLEAQPPPPEASGLWFGLFNPVRGGVATADLHLAGAPYDHDDLDWNIELTWTPHDGEARSRVLDAIYRLAYPAVSATGASSPEEQDVCRDAISRFLANDAEYPLALAYAALGARRLVTDHASALLASRARERIVFAGFDSGDAICIGALRPDGLRFSSASEQMRWHSSTSRFSVG